MVDVDKCKHKERGFNVDCEECKSFGWKCSLIVCLSCGIEVGPY